MNNIKKVQVNNNYYIKITYNDNNIHRLYTLYNKEGKKLCESFNRDSFLLKCRNYVKLTSNIECLVASY